VECSAHEVTDTSEEEYSCFRILLFKIRHNKKKLLDGKLLAVGLTAVQLCLVRHFN